MGPLCARPVPQKASSVRASRPNGDPRAAPVVGCKFCLCFRIYFLLRVLSLCFSVATVKCKPNTLPSLLSGAGLMYESPCGFLILILLLAAGSELRRSVPSTAAVWRKAFLFASELCHGPWLSSWAEPSNSQELIRDGPFPCRRQASIFPFCSCCLSMKMLLGLLIHRWPLGSLAAGRPPSHVLLSSLMGYSTVLMEVT